MTTYEILSVLISLIATFLIFIQLKLAVKSLQSDHERRQKQATIEYMRAIRPTWLKSRDVIEEHFGKNPLTDQCLQEIMESTDLRINIRNLLGQFEHLAIGMNSKVYNKDLLYRASGSLLIGIHYRLKGYIDGVRKENDNKYLYKEFTELVAEFEDRKRLKPNKKGNISF